MLGCPSNIDLKIPGDVCCVFGKDCVLGFGVLPLSKDTLRGGVRSFKGVVGS